MEIPIELFNTIIIIFIIIVVGLFVFRVLCCFFFFLLLSVHELLSVDKASVLLEESDLSLSSAWHSESYRLLQATFFTLGL